MVMKIPLMKVTNPLLPYLFCLAILSTLTQKETLIYYLTSLFLFCLGGHKKKFLPSVSTSLALASAFGIMETIALFFGSGLLLNTMGIPVDSPMRVPAEQFTSIRAFGAPAIVLALAAQGTFRGFKDTKTPLYAIGSIMFLDRCLSPRQVPVGSTGSFASDIPLGVGIFTKCDRWCGCTY
ncbi:hypothetical protein L1887_09006 [Cichorium endivia]|nr:hypothetical protein L1887_09006 [Cichorium endivia]